MGTFDRVELNGIEWQTKALGKTMHTLRPGDRVSAARVASTDDPRDVRGYTYDDLPDRYLVEIHAVQYVLVENGKLVGLATDADRSELIYDTFDYYGRDEADGIRHIFDIPRPPRVMTPIPRGPGRPRRPSKGDE